MRCVRRRMKTWAILFAIACLMEGAVAEAVLIPKVDNFVFFLDQSGSMYMHHGTLGKVKMTLAKKILKDMNGLIPEWGYTGAICLFSPFHLIQQPATYLQTEFGAGLGKIRDEQEIFGRPTQWGAGLRGLDQVLAQLNGVTALILISDGETSQEHHELLMEVLQLRITHLQAHFYILSLADKETDRELLQEIAQTGNATLVEAEDLLEGFALEEFTNSVFLEETPEKPAAPSATVVPGLQPILFDSGRFEIGAELAAVLDEAAGILSSHTDGLILVEGHADSAGIEEANQLISERRAKSVRDYLIEKEIPEDRIKAMGYGQLRPAATNDTAEGRAMNRRVEIKIVK